jgi:hypothetical protein
LFKELHRGEICHEHLNYDEVMDVEFKLVCGFCFLIFNAWHWLYFKAFFVGSLSIIILSTGLIDGWIKEGSEVQFIRVLFLVDILVLGALLGSLVDYFFSLLGLGWFNFHPLNLINS